MGDYDLDDRDISLDDDDYGGGGGKLDWLKMAKGEIIRAAFIFFYPIDRNAVIDAVKQAKVDGKPPLTEAEKTAIGRKALVDQAAKLNKKELTAIDKLDLGNVKFKHFHAHYVEGWGYFLSRLGLDGPEADVLWRSPAIKEARPYYSTLLLVYPSTKGDISKHDAEVLLKEGKGWKPIPWRMGPGLYAEGVRKANIGLRANGLSLASQDFKLECKDAQFQKITLTPQGPALWQRSPSLKASVLNTAMTLYDQLIPFNERSTDWLREKLGLQAPAATDVSAENFEDYKDNLADMLDKA